MASGPARSSPPPPPEHPALRALANAPPDDEPVTDEDREAIEEALEDVRAGRLLSHDEVRRSLDKP